MIILPNLIAQLSKYCLTAVKGYKNINIFRIETKKRQII